MLQRAVVPHHDVADQDRLAIAFEAREQRLAAVLLDHVDIGNRPEVGDIDAVVPDLVDVFGIVAPNLYLDRHAE